MGQRQGRLEAAEERRAACRFLSHPGGRAFAGGGTAASCRPCLLASRAAAASIPCALPGTVPWAALGIIGTFPPAAWGGTIFQVLY